MKRFFLKAKTMTTSLPNSRYARSRSSYDNRVTAMMVDDMRFNPILASKVLIGIDIPPHQEIRLMMMWTTYYTCDDSGFSTGKTFTNALVAALRSMLFPDRVSGILSKTFAQGKLTFQYFDRWYNSSKIFRCSVRHQYGKPRLVHGNSLYQAVFRGESEIRVLPPNFMQDAERIRSERWNDGYFDEWTTFGNFGAFNSTIIGRVTRNNNFPECPVQQNHIHLSSTPGFTHNPAYKIVKRIARNIASGSKDYARFTSNYRHVPRTDRWRGIVNRKVIFTMQTTNPPGVVRSEIDGLWQKDSLSYYSSRDIDQARVIHKPTLHRKSDSDVYIAGFDSARGGASQTTRGDDFAVTVLRSRPGVSDNIEHVLTERVNNVTSKQMAGIIHGLHRDFQFSLICYDVSGGGLFVKDELSERQQLINNEPTLVTPLLNFGEATGVIGDQIMIPFIRSNHWIKMITGTMQSDSILVNRMHREVLTLIQTNKLDLIEEWPGWEASESQWDIDSLRQWLNKAAGLSYADRIHAESDLAVRQLMQVDVDRDDNGVPRIDRFGMYRFLSSHKKDAAYSLCYAVFGFVIYNSMQGFAGSNFGGSEGFSAVAEDI